LSSAACRASASSAMIAIKGAATRGKPGDEDEDENEDAVVVVSRAARCRAPRCDCHFLTLDLFSGGT